MRERLIELIVKNGCEEYGGNSKCDGNCFHRCDKCETTITVGELADHLIGEGVIVPPVKIGQTCYRVWERELIELKVVSISYEPSPAYSYLIEFDKIGKLCLMKDGSKNEEYSWDDVFLTKEEAEKALAERSKR